MAKGSWVIVRRATGEAVLETFNRDLITAINTKAYEVLTAREYLGRLNAAIKADA